jgi:hypothetical protein
LILCSFIHALEPSVDHASPPLLEQTARLVEVGGPALVPEHAPGPTPHEDETRGVAHILTSKRKTQICLSKSYQGQMEGQCTMVTASSSKWEGRPLSPNMSPDPHHTKMKLGVSPTS